MKKLIPPKVFALLFTNLHLSGMILFSVLSAGRLPAQCGTVISTFPYSEGFETSAAWTSGGNNSSWAWGAMSHPVIASSGSGTRSWCSGGLSGSSYSGSQQSWIMSPCFDFTSLNYPWISFKIFWECEYQWDGMVLQYSVNGGTSWANVGASGDPVNCLNANWYNHGNISNLTQASPRHGWCGRIGPTSGSCSGGNGSGGWVTAKHCLTGLANQPSVRFRFLFGSGTTCNSYDGIAIDDILIQDAPANAANFSYVCSGMNVVNFTNTSAQCPNSFSWNFGDPSTGASNVSSLANPSHSFSAPGTYTVSLTASGPCNAPSTTLIPISILSVSTSVSNLKCNGASNGSSTVTVGGGTPGYSYTWMPTGGNASVAAGLPAGVYTVSVKDNGSCLTRITTTITQPPGMSAVVTQTNVSCNGFSDGTASAQISLGAAPYSYTWHPTGNLTPAISGLTAGTYTLQVKDRDDCLAVFVATITQPAVLNIVAGTTSVSCRGGTNGAVQTTVTGGTAGYSYSWNPPQGTLSSAQGLGAGQYTVTVKDSHNCLASHSVTVIQPPTHVTASVLTTSPTCGLSNGSATIIATGGTPGYNYSWSPSGGSQSTASALAGGAYSVIVTDNNNCAFLLTAMIPVSYPLMVAVTPGSVSCFGAFTGSAVSSISGGIPPYTYTWSSATGNQPGGFIRNGLAAGSYTLHVKDANACPSQALFMVASPAPLMFTPTVSPVSCYGGNNGSISFTASGGTPVYSFSSSGGSLTGPLTGLSAGKYFFQVKDTNHCVTNSTVIVTQPQAPLSVVLSGTNIPCYGSLSGGAKALVSGGTPGYSYSWSPTGGPAAEIHGLPAANYTLWIKDLNGCALVSALSLTQPAQPLSASVVVSSVTCFGGNNGSATVSPQGGTPGYILGWPTFSNNLRPMNYTVSVTDKQNCSVTVTFAIAQPPQISLTATASKFCSGQPGILTASVTGASLPLSYNWNGTSSTSSVISLTHTRTVIYTVSAADAKGCESNKDTVLVYIPGDLELSVPATVSVCQGQQTMLAAGVSGGDGRYMFTWQPGSLRGPVQTILPEAASEYTVTVSDGCLAKKSAVVKLDYYEVPVSQITFSRSGVCLPVCVSFTNSASTPVSSQLLKACQWNFGDGYTSPEMMPKHCYRKPGKFVIQVQYTTVNGCVGVETMEERVYVEPGPKADFLPDKKELSALDPLVNLTNLSRDATRYNWYFNDGTVSSEEHTSHFFLSAGEQQIILIAGNDLGCKDTVIKKIDVTPEFTFFAPNVFSPNSDNINDVFLPKGLGWNTSKFEMTIYNRWGERIFITKNYDEGWNGKMSGDIVQNGVYVWKVLMYDVFNKLHEFMGHVEVK